MTPLRISYPTLAAAILATGFASYVSAQEQRLGEVVVTASGFEQAVQDAPASITVIPKEELEKKAYGDITDVLRDVPGVEITGSGSSTDISIRGMSAGYTLILIDGRRQNTRESRPNSDGPGIEQGWLPPVNAIERIEVVRGPMSSLYGADAMGGVINIITKKVRDKWEGSVSQDAMLQDDSDAGDAYHTTVGISGPVINNVLGLKFNGKKSHRDEDKIINGFNKSKNVSGNLQLDLVAIKDQTLSFGLGRSIQDRKATLGNSVDAVTSATDQKYLRTNYNITHQGKYGGITSNTYFQSDKTDSPTRNIYLKSKEFNSQWNNSFTENSISSLGVFYRGEELRDANNQVIGQSGDIKSYLERDQWAVFAENEWSVFDNFNLTTGLRLNHDDSYGSHWTPRIYGVWHLDEKFTLKGGVSSGYKSPLLRHAVSDWGQITGRGAGVILGNPDLAPEKSINQELSLVFDNKKNLSYSVTAFNTDFKDRIAEEEVCREANWNAGNSAASRCQAEGKGWRFINKRMNIDKSVVRGLELTATWQANNSIRLASNYTFTKSEIKSGVYAGTPLNKMPRHKLNVAFDWKATQNVDVWSKMTFKGKTSEYMGRFSAVDKQAPSHSIFDAGLKYKYSKHLSLGFGVYNIFNKKMDYEQSEFIIDGRRYWLNATAFF